MNRATSTIIPVVLEFKYYKTCSHQPANQQVFLWAVKSFLKHKKWKISKHKTQTKRTKTAVRKRTRKQNIIRRRQLLFESLPGQLILTLNCELLCSYQHSHNIYPYPPPPHTHRLPRFWWNEARQRCVWGVLGVCLGCIWGVFQVCLGCVY